MARPLLFALSMKTLPHTRPHWIGLGFFVLALAVATPLAAQTADDADGDGVPDTIDACLDTPPADIVGVDGCSVCECDVDGDGNAWTSHQAYVSCVATAAKERRRSRSITRAHKRAAVRTARASSCGNANLTRCCVYVTLDDNADVNIGQCRIMTPDQCDAIGAQVDYAEDIDAGSCVPNPCEF